MKFLYALRYIHTASKLTYGAILAVTLTYELLKHRKYDKRKNQNLIGNNGGSF